MKLDPQRVDSALALIRGKVDPETYSRFIALLMADDPEAAQDSARVKEWAHDFASRPTRAKLAADTRRGRGRAAFVQRYPEADKIGTV